MCGNDARAREGALTPIAATRIIALMMYRHLSSSKRLRRTLVGASIVVGLCTLHPSPAAAHFMLEAPASWMSQDPSGLPQKLGPCGNEGGGTATGDVTTYAPGDTVTITIDEVIFHPGHYRVALSTDGQNGLPAEPPVTAADTPCGSTVVESPPVYPILADGLFTHTTAFTAPQTAQVKLPTNVTCTNCTLQVIEFMGEHPLNNPGGCFYHHCANIKIVAPGDGGPSQSSSSSSTSGASSSASGSGTSGSNASGSGTSGSGTSGSGASGASASGSGGSSGTGTSGSGTSGSNASGSSVSGGNVTAGAGGAGTGEGPSAASGCKCSMPGAGTPASLGSLAVLAALLRRRRRG